jgi:DNA-binding NarL/FixJ family response regulator
VLDAIRGYLEQQGIDVVGEASNGVDAADRIAKAKPGVAILDIRMPQLSGIEVARRLARTTPETAVILYTGMAERPLVIEALDIGVRGFVLKEAPVADLMRAINTIGAGGSYVDPVIGAVIAGAPDNIPQLSPREREILRLLAEGCSNEEAGRRLFIATATVRTYLGRIMEKLDADTRTQAVAVALRQSLIS